jgi:hypothetical protein
MTSLYGKYIAEREGKHILEKEHGFATYLFESDYCYIVDIYVEPEHRRSKLCYQMADEIALEAKEKGYTKLVGSVCPQAIGATASLKVLLNYGFELMKSGTTMIYFIKEL